MAGKWSRKLNAEDGVPILAVGFYFTLAMVAGLNIGHRHILPVYPILFAGAGALCMGS